MKLGKLALLSIAGMLLSTATVYALTGLADEQPPARAIKGLEPAVDQIRNQQQLRPRIRTQFVTGKTLRVEGRVGHQRLARLGDRETYLMLEVLGADQPAARRSPVAMVLAVDRSGSMKGSRIDNAVNAATRVVDTLGDGDTVSVLAFDTQVQEVVPKIRVSAATKPSIKEAVRGIRLGGDTCISCGIEQAFADLATAGDFVKQIIVLSDGEANNGVRDEAGFKGLGRQAAQRQIAVTTIGVGLDYNEKILTAVTFASNGRHHFVEDDESLAKVLLAETESALATVARNATATITLAEHTELIQVFERRHRIEGNRIVVPLGNFSRREAKTVLVKLRSNNAAAGMSQLASMDVGFHDLVTGDRSASVRDHLSLVMADDSAEIDPFVLMRVQRSHTGKTLGDATDLFNQGKADQARQKLKQHRQSLRKAAERARAAAKKSGDARSGDIDYDFEAQEVDAKDAYDKLKPKKGPAPKPKATAGKRWNKYNRSRQLKWSL